MKTAVAQLFAPPDIEGAFHSAELWARKARDADASLLAFPETWIPGYPAWVDVCRDVAIWAHPPVQHVYERLAVNSVSVAGAEGRRLRELAGDIGINIVVGVTERVDEGAGRRTLYNTLLTLGANGKLLNHHRKLMPTHGERLVWGIGDADGLRAVEIDGVRVGGLICWEHWMPLARQVMHVAGEDVHVAAWPMVAEMHLIASRHYAFEGRCWVLACGSLLRASDLPPELEVHPDKVSSPDQLVLRGGSCVIRPDGSLATEQLFDQEGLIICDLDLSMSRRESIALDVTGHYSRSDAISLRVERRGDRVTADD